MEALDEWVSARVDAWTRVSVDVCVCVCVCVCARARECVLSWATGVSAACDSITPGCKAPAHLTQRRPRQGAREMAVQVHLRGHTASCHASGAAATRPICAIATEYRPCHVGCRAASAGGGRPRHTAQAQQHGNIGGGRADMGRAPRRAVPTLGRSSHSSSMQARSFANAPGAAKAKPSVAARARAPSSVANDFMKPSSAQLPAVREEVLPWAGACAVCVLPPLSRQREASHRATSAGTEAMVGGGVCVGRCGFLFLHTKIEEGKSPPSLP